jgi:hypothetical protein
MRCASVTVSNPEQLSRVHHEEFDAALIDIVNPGMAAERAIVSLRELHSHLSERILAFSSGAMSREMLEPIACDRYPGKTCCRRSGRLCKSSVAGSNLIKLAPRGMEVA